MKNSSIALFLVFLLAGCITTLDTDLQSRRVQLLAPANNLITTDTVHTFYWNPVDGADDYQLQVVSPRFDSIARLVADTVVPRNQLRLALPGNLGYQWRVRALNSSSSTAYSDTFHLTIQ